ncbi:GPR4 protein, partial [Atractosteus spatula]|nr:GPR4 protein [Atractosteus spatula]
MENSTVENGTAPDELLVWLTGIDIFEIVFYSCIVCIGLPINCLAAYRLYHLVKASNVLPIYVINLLISDMLQLAMLPLILLSFYTDLLDTVYYLLYHWTSINIFSMCVSISFFVCISLERYLAVVHPLWHQSHRSPRFAIKVSVGVWLFAGMCFTVENLLSMRYVLFIFVLFVLFFLVPLILLVFFYVRTKAAITSSIGAPDVKKKRALRVLSAVLVLFIVVYGPFFTVIVFRAVLDSMRIFASIGLIALAIVSDVISSLNIIVNPILYVLLRNDVRETLNTTPFWRMLMWSVCCCCGDRVDEDTSAVKQNEMRSEK